MMQRPDRLVARAFGECGSASQANLVSVCRLRFSPGAKSRKSREKMARRDEISGTVDCGAKSGAQGRDRTADTAIFSRMLYQLSYLGQREQMRPGEAMRALARLAIAVQSVALRRWAGNSVAVVEPFHQVAVLAAAAAERGVVGRWRLAAQRAIFRGSGHGQLTWEPQGRRARSPRRRPGAGAGRASLTGARSPRRRRGGRRSGSPR